MRAKKVEGRHKKRKARRKTARDRLKEEVAAEIGLGEKLRRLGWGALTARETGRVGGLMARRLKKGG